MRAFSSIALVSLVLAGCAGALKLPTRDAAAAKDGASGGSGDRSADAAPEEPDEEGERSDVPVEVTGAFLTCDEARPADGADGRAYYGCSAVDRNGEPVSLAGVVWEVARTDDGTAVAADVTIGGPGASAATISFDATLVGAVEIRLAGVTGEPGTLPSPVELSFPTTPPPKPAGPDDFDLDLGGAAGLGELCRGGYSALQVLDGNAVCPEGAAMVSVNDGRDVAFSCCQLPPGVLRAAEDDDDGKGGGLKLKGSDNVPLKSDPEFCGPGEVQVGLRKSLAPVCRAIDLAHYRLARTRGVVYVNRESGLPAGLDQGIAADLDAHIEALGTDDACVCPDLRMVLAGGHERGNNTCNDRCVLILPR